MNALYIAIAGGLGSVSRYLLSKMVAHLMAEKGGQFPWPTFVVNVLGSACMGILVGVLLSRGLLESRWRLILAVGFLGGFTTYSSFALESVALLEERNWHGAAFYLLGTLFLAGMACVGGLWLGKRL